MNDNTHIKKLGGVVFGVLLLLVFFSRTIYNYNTPTVTGVLPSKSKLSKTEKSTGIADWTVVEEVYFEVAGKIEEVYFREGDNVSKGQSIARLSFDTDDIMLKLSNLETEKNKIEVSLESARLKSEQLTAQIEDLRQEIYEADDIAEYDLRQLEAKIQKAADNLQSAVQARERAEQLYQTGVIPRADLENAEKSESVAQYELDSLELDYESLKKSKADTAQKNAEDIEDMEKSRAKQIAGLEYELLTLEQDVKSKRLDIQKNLDEQDSLRDLLQKNDENIFITAPVDGELTELSFKKGQNVSKSQHAASVAVGGLFTITCKLSLENNFVVPGDECRLTNTDRELVATVRQLSFSDTSKEVTIELESSEISAGETFDVEFGKESANAAVLVPNGAVNKDSDGYFVYQIKTRKGILGDEYYADRLSVYIGDSDDTNTVITSGITFFEPLVLLSDVPFSSGDRIKLSNEGDFFVN